MFHFNEKSDYQNIDSLNISISDMSHVVLSDKWAISDMCSSPYTRIYMVIKGKGKLILQDSEITMTAGNIYVIPSGLPFSYSCDDGFEKIYFHISLSYSDKTDILSAVKGCVMLKNREHEIKEVIDYKKCNTVFGAMKIKYVIYGIVCEVIQEINEMPIKKHSDSVLKAIGYIEENLHFGLSAEEVADNLFASVHGLRKLFKHEVGIPIGKYINNRIMEKAEKILRFTDKSVKEISDELGFCDQFYFSKCFSSVYGVPPYKYKNSII